jgi:DnaK suppressor protein
MRLAIAEMSLSTPDGMPDDPLARRAEDLEMLRQAEHDTADTADFTYQRELQQTTQQLLAREKAQVEAALRARQTGTYGVCQECGQPIPPERLAARPEATLCVDCQRRLEGSHT